MLVDGQQARVTDKVLDVQVDVITWEQATERISNWACQRQSRYVSICDVHSVVLAGRNEAHGQHLRSADLVTPDGWPVAWMLRQCGHTNQERINGPDLMWRLLSAAEKKNLPVYFYGTTDATLSALRIRLKSAFPSLQVAGMYSPPFRPLTAEEDAADVERINASGAQLVMTGLGCPKEDRWMFEHRGRVQAVMLGIGAGVDFWACKVPRAPHWMRNHGLEWLFRLACEPRRLWRRYLVHNSLFVTYAAQQLIKNKIRQLLRA
jgi:N-acetylglucosaminyldiphosphoundecaprenol N-acetyl-beta-D-mannosaminyltransferase